MIDRLAPAAAPASAPTPDAAKKAELVKAAQAFEAVFIRQMIGSMRQAGFGDELFGSSATEQFREMQDARMADAMAEKGAFGIAELLLKQFEGVAK